jgi:hypothetical protein
MQFQFYMELTPVEQELVMWTEGVPVASRVMNGCRCLLVQLYSFYVEVIYPLDRDVIKGFHPFEGTDNLEPYLPQIIIEFH